MKQLIFATGNDHKVLGAQSVCAAFGVQLIQNKSLHVEEIQGEDGQVIARHKANEVFKQLQRPCIITDDTWIIPALGGFPGPYMKSVNAWFKSGDWLRLMRGIEDRRAILRQIAVYQDARRQKVFAVDIEGKILKEAHGEDTTYPAQNIISLDPNGRSITEFVTQGRSALEGRSTVWHDLGEWLSSLTEHERQVKNG